MTNRRATVSRVIKDNSIYGILITSNGYTRSTVPMHYRRRFQDGTIRTGRAYKSY